MLSLITQGIGFGFSAGASVGPFQSYLINTTLNHGWRKGLPVVFAPLVADGPIIVLMIVLLKDLSPELKRLIQLAGGLYLLRLVWGNWRQLRKGAQFAPANGAHVVDRTLGQGVLMIYLSPGPYIYWGTILGPLLVQGLKQSVWHGIAFMLAFYGTFLTLLALWVVVFDRLRRIDPRVTWAALALTALILLVFGLSLVAQAVGLMA